MVIQLWNAEFGRLWKEESVAKREALFQNLSGGTEEY